MSDLLDLVVHGDPAACRTAATDIGTARTTVTTGVEDVRRAVRTAGTWQGQAGDAFEVRVDAAVKDLRELDKRLESLGSALTDFAGELDVVRSRMAHARSVGVAGGVRTSGESLVRPEAPTDATPAQVTAHNDVVKAWNEAVEVADAARTKEQEAHKRLGDGVKKSTGDGFVVDLLQRLGFLPPTSPTATTSARGSSASAAWASAPGWVGWSTAATASSSRGSTAASPAPAA